MGLIILPLLAAWFATFVYSGCMLYAIFSGDKPLWYAAATFGLGGRVGLGLSANRPVGL